VKLIGINVYPVKSLAGFSVDRWEAAEEGLLFDRKWMLVDRDGNFCTQRKFPQMSRLCATIPDSRLLIQDLTSGESIEVPQIDPERKKEETVQVWKDKTTALAAPEETNAWLSTKLGFAVTLYHQTFSAKRKHTIFGTEKTVSFADSQPFLIIGTASLQDLNERMGASFTMDRFRPNLIVETTVPYEEDSWKKVQVGNLFLKKTKLCGRCKMVNVNPKKGQFENDVLQFLGTYRKQQNSINFGIRTTWADFSPGKWAKVGQEVVPYT
jgi:uncharacterized protein YcbX